MRSLKAAFLVLFLAVSGCGKKLRPDPAPMSAIDAGLYTVEWKACGETFNGVGICEAEKGESFGSLQVQGYFKGTITINSVACGLDESFRYEKNALINIDLPKRAEESCVVDVVLSPELPGEEDSGIRVYPIKGRLYLRVVEKDWHFFSRTDKLSSLTDRELFLPYNYGDEARVVFRGCGSEFDETMETEDGSVRIRLSNVIELGEQKTCILNGAVISDRRTTRVTWMVNVYNSVISRQPEPKVSFQDGEISIEADPAVTVLNLDGKSEISNEAEFKFEKTKPHILRSLTVKGRNIIGIWYPDTENWSWLK